MLGLAQQILGGRWWFWSTSRIANDTSAHYGIWLSLTCCYHGLSIVFAPEIITWTLLLHALILVQVTIRLIINSSSLIILRKLSSRIRVVIRRIVYFAPLRRNRLTLLTSRLWWWLTLSSLLRNIFNVVFLSLTLFSGIYSFIVSNYGVFSWCVWARHDISKFEWHCRIERRSLMILVSSCMKVVIVTRWLAISCGRGCS